MTTIRFAVNAGLAVTVMYLALAMVRVGQTVASTGVALAIMASNRFSNHLLNAAALEAEGGDK